LWFQSDPGEGIMSDNELWWSVAAAVALVAGAVWLRQADLPYVAASAGATVAACVLAARATGRKARAARVTSLLLLVFCAVAGIGQARLRQIDVAWPSVARELSDASRRGMRDAVEADALALRAVATDALHAPNDPAAAFAWLARARRDHLHGPGETGVVLFRKGEPVAWAGTMRSAPVEDTAAFVVVRSPFYVTLQAAATDSSGDRAVAVALLHAAPPADRISAPLDEAVARRTGVSGFTLGMPSAGVFRRNAGDVVKPLGRPLLAVEPRPPRLEELAPVMAARWQSRGALIFALALAAFVVAAWSPGSSLRLRLAALVVPVAAVAIVPLNAFSNVSPIFDPTYFYSPTGGPFTSTVAALGATSVLAVLGALAAARAHVRIRPRALALTLALVSSVVGPYLLQGLAEGITPPSSGIPVELWVVWQVTLAMAALAVLIVAGIAAQSALGRHRGVPAWWAVVIAVGAALLGPIIWEPPAVWPLWYPPLWVLAATVTIFVGQPRWRILTAAVTAGLGTAVLIWGTSAQKRVGLATRDVAGLREPDRTAQNALERFGADLEAAPAPDTRAALLTMYAPSLLAAEGYPVALATWWPDSAGQLAAGASLMLDRFAIPEAAVLRTALRAYEGDSAVLDSAEGSPGEQLVLAVPNGAGGVTTVVVAAQTRLISPEPFAPLFGIPGDTPSVPAYTVTPIGLASSTSPSKPEGVWTRQGNALHADWLVAGAAGPERAHVEIDLRSLDTLAERGTLLLLLDLILVGVLWMVAAVAGGGFWRWLRSRARRWANSYRAQLTVVLYAFFLAPAILFAVWSYNRLASDDAQSRALLVWETLRTIARSGQIDQLVQAGDQFDTPIFLYRDGELRATSDTLLAELAPLGHYLPPDVELGLGLATEVTAKRVESLAGTRSLLGYRAATDANGEAVIMAAPARANDVELDRRRSDLSLLLLFASAMGAVAALWLSGLAARQLARPIDALRRAALAAASGEREPDLGREPPAEFTPVYSAFRRMAADFGASQRVLAWGEMARQVAHEIKNPLTPIRLGMQHLLRARADARPDFDHILQQNATRILAEIDRLDSIARAFSRYGTAPEERPPGEPTDIGAVVRDVVELERMGVDGVVWSMSVEPSIVARARAEELREVLLNVLENARLARARRVEVRAAPEPGRVVVTVQDDGDGIPKEIMPRIFEPRFSTRTSGSGLGLAISRRLVDGWGGSIAVVSERGRGTMVTISLIAVRQ
jgi:two-component system, NtrC family, nitrogen regulation sensor histidine kinase NtrY